MTITMPTPHTAPPHSGRTIVGIPNFLWIDADQWQAHHASDSDRGLSVTVTAVPQAVYWSMGDHTTVVCDGPGEPYRAGDTQPACGHTYTHDSHQQPEGRYTVTVTMAWAARWTATNGDGGTFPPILVTTQFAWRVNQLQAALD